MANREIHIEKHEDTFDLRTSDTWKGIGLTVLIGCFIGFLAPFGMHQIPVYISVAYWVTTCIMGYCIYSPIITLGHKFLSAKMSIRWHRVALSTVAASVPMSFAVPLTTWLFFDVGTDVIGRFSSIFPKTLLIGGFITSVSFLRERLDIHKSALKEVESQHDTATQKPVDDFINALPVSKRGKLLCMEMSDHYVKVYTDKGHHMLLMRFKDAMLALQSYPGLQTHRSWWVAKDAVVSVKKEQRKTFLVLSNDVEVPVSRTFTEEVKAAGLQH